MIQKTTKEPDNPKSTRLTVQVSSITDNDGLTWKVFPRGPRHQQVYLERNHIRIPAELYWSGKGMTVIFFDSGIHGENPI